MSTPRFTVLGAGGFIGRHLVAHLRERGYQCDGLQRGDDLWPARPLGQVIYCLGVTADFRNRPFDTVRAHVSLLTDFLQKARFDSLLYLSSARVYMGLDAASEDAPLCLLPANPDQLYNATKLTGEAVCFASRRPGVRVARPSNVFGDDYASTNFLPSIIRDAVTARHVRLQSAPESVKDYVPLDDVVEILTRIALNGRHLIYNIASGTNTSNGQIVEALAKLTGCTVSVAPGAPCTELPPIDISRVRSEFGIAPGSLLDRMPDLVSGFQKAHP